MAISVTMQDGSLPDLECQSQAECAAALAPMGEEEFRTFYDRTARPVWAYLWRLTSDRHLADDLLQEAYYRFYRAGASHANEDHRRSSLYRIATNLARDHGRRQRHRNDVSLADRDDLLASDSTVDSQAADRTDLVRAMAHLKPAQREMLWLAYAQGSSHQEIAVVLDLKVANVKALLYRARQKLATLLRGSRPGGLEHD